MDTTKQLHEIEAHGWKRGVYDDIKRTFRAPIVNWIFRTTMANEPEFLRYAWGQIKPVFETRAFGRFSVRYRDTILTTLEAEEPLPVYRAGDVDLAPAAYRELQGQLATYDVVAPRLAVLFELMDRALHDRPIRHKPITERAATSPFPDWLDRDRGRAPTLLDLEDVPETLEHTIDAVQTFHGFDNGLPSIYRTLAQWPSFLEPLWADIEPRVESDGFSTACKQTDEYVASFVDSSPYRPRLGPDDLSAIGFDENSIAAVQEVYREFNTGSVETVLPALPIFAATIDAAGERDVL